MNTVFNEINCPTYLLKMMCEDNKEVAMLAIIKPFSPIDFNKIIENNTFIRPSNILERLCLRTLYNDVARIIRNGKTLDCTKN